MKMLVRWLIQVLARVILKMISKRGVYLTFWDENLKVRISRTKLEDDELLNARSIELDRWFRSWANAKRQIECKCGRNEWIWKSKSLMKRLAKNSNNEIFWMKFLNSELLIWRYRLISVSSSLISARGVVWLRQCRLSWWDELSSFSA
jgi:hypothetical protein